MLYRLNIKMGSCIHGNINSNTIFGLICTAYKVKYGEDELELLLNNLMKSNEELVLSDPLKKNTVDFIDKDEINQASKITMDRIGCYNELNLEQSLVIDEFDVLMYTTIKEEKIHELLKLCRILGIGSYKNSGCGRINSINIKKENIIDLSNKKTVRSLANIFPSDNTPIHGDINYTVRNGVTIDGKNQKSIIMIESGSTFINTGINITGSLVYDKETSTYINGRSLLV